MGCTRCLCGHQKNYRYLSHLPKILGHKAIMRTRKLTMGLFPVPEATGRLCRHACSKWIQALVSNSRSVIRVGRSFPNKADAGGVIKALLKEIIPRYGVPKSIGSDRGSHFTADIINQIYRSLGIERRLHTPYHPRASGQVERTNQTIKGK